MVRGVSNAGGVGGVGGTGGAGPAPAGLRPGAEADAWRSAAEMGTARRAVAPVAPAWVPASATLAVALQAEILDWARAGVPNEACGLLAADRVAEDGGTPTRFRSRRATFSATL